MKWYDIMTGNIMKKIREDRNMTVKEISDILEIDTELYLKYEDGRYMPNKYIIRLADLYNLEPIDILGR